MNYELIRKNHNRIIRFAFSAMKSKGYLHKVIAKKTELREADISESINGLSNHSIDKCLKIMCICNSSFGGAFVFDEQMRVFKIITTDFNKSFTFEEMIDTIKKKELR